MFTDSQFWHLLRVFKTSGCYFKHLEVTKAQKQTQENLQNKTKIFFWPEEHAEKTGYEFKVNKIVSLNFAEFLHFCVIFRKSLFSKFDKLTISTENAQIVFFWSSFGLKNDIVCFNIILCKF